MGSPLQTRPYDAEMDTDRAADSYGSDAIRWIAPGLRQSAPQPKSEPQKREARPNLEARLTSPGRAALGNSEVGLSGEPALGRKTPYCTQPPEQCVPRARGRRARHSSKQVPETATPAAGFSILVGRNRSSVEKPKHPTCRSRPTLPAAIVTGLLSAAGFRTRTQLHRAPPTATQKTPYKRFRMPDSTYAQQTCTPFTSTMSEVCGGGMCRRGRTKVATHGGVARHTHTHTSTHMRTHNGILSSAVVFVQAVQPTLIERRPTH